MTRRVVIIGAGPGGLASALLSARAGVDVLVKTSGVGVYDGVLEQAVLESRRDGTKVIFWDVDAPATLTRMESDPDDPLRSLVPDYDLVLTYGGGQPVVERYRRLGARRCVPIYNALDPRTHFPVPAQERFAGDLSALVNRLPDREARVQEFFFAPVEAVPERLSCGAATLLPRVPEWMALPHPAA